MALRAASALALLGATALAQYGGWDDEQANTTMCTWKLPRGENPPIAANFADLTP